MRYPTFTAAQNRLIPLALVVATALGGCVAYPGYPSSGYANGYPSGYNAGYARPYSTSYTYRPYYSPGYNRYNNNY